MTFEGLAGTGIGGGRHLRAGVASRLRLQGGMDASRWLAWRPDQRWRANWTPFVNEGGVQIWDGAQIGRLSVVGVAASRLR